MNQRSNVTKRILCLMLALLMVLGNVANPLSGTSKVYAAEPLQAGSWAELRTAINNAPEGQKTVIEITQDFEANSKDVSGGTMKIGGKKTIELKAKDGENVTIFRREGDVNFPMFEMANANGELILGEGLTLSGMTSGDCGDSGSTEEPQEFKVVFHNGGEGDKAKQTDPEVVAVGQSIDKDPTSIASDWAPETGLVFKGWKFKGPNGNENSTTGNNPNTSTGSWKVPEGKYGTMTLVAQWEKQVQSEEFKVVFHNGGEGDKAKQTDPEVVAVGQSIDKDPASIASDWAPETGLVFKGWKFKGPNGNENSTTGNNPNTSTGSWKVPEGKYGTMTLVAQWEKPEETGTFKVVFHNGGSGDAEKKTDPQEIAAGSKPFFDPATVENWAPEEGLVFKGWKFIGPGGNTNTTDGTEANWTVPSDKYGTMTLVAQWEKPGSGERDGLNYNGKTFYRQTDASMSGVGRIGIYGSNPGSSYTAATKVYIKDGKVYYVDGDGEYKLGVYRGDIWRQTGTYENYVTLLEVEEDPSDPTKVYLKAGGTYYGDYNPQGTPRWSTGKAAWTVSPGAATPFESIEPIAWAADEGTTTATPYTSINPIAWQTNEPTTEAYPSIELPSWTEQQATPPQQKCDGECKEWTKDDFSSGSPTNPNGFFVKVTSGTVTLAGATLENFVTSDNKDKTPKHVAPVAVVGSSSKFIVEKGSISNNIVGYVAKDDRSTNGANQIKKYIKGAAPNARRKNAPEPDDGTKKRRNSAAGIDEGDPGSGITGTAGAIIYAAGAQGEIKGGSIDYNRADTGGIMVTGEGSLVRLKAKEGDYTGADINHNVGVQFGGGTTVEQGGTIIMEGGKIHDNVAWFGGGAVFATQNGVKWLIGKETMSKSDRIDGYFTMLGGEIFGNNAFTRGGGFLVDSNGVSLISGVIRDNTSRVLGGGAYVMGDHKDYSYTLYIESGQIYANEALTADQNEPTDFTGSNTAMSKALKSANPCGEKGEMFGSSMGSTSDDIADFQRINDGTGGGVWTCSYGSTVLDLDATKVYIHDNKAHGSTGNTADPRTAKNKVGGQDFHSDNGGDGTLLMINADSTKWWDENAKEMYTPGEVDAEIRNLKYDGPEGNKTTGVQIYHNTSRRGGGLAADGTFVFGERRNVARITADLEISKVWDGDLTPKPVMIQIGVEGKDKAGNTKKGVIRDLELDGNADAGTDEDSIHENEGTANSWSGGFNLPVTVDAEDGSGLITVFKLLGPDGTEYDPSDEASMKALAAALESGSGEGFKLSSDAKLTFTELVKTDSGYEKTDEFKFTPGEVEVKDLSVDIKKVYRMNAQGEKEFVLSVSFATVPLKAELRNEAPDEDVPGPEKYIDKVVHTSLPAFDETFEYAVLAYVPNDATEVVLTDTLEEPLEFVNKTKKTVLSGFYVLAENDSKGDGNGTVATTPRDKVGGNTLRVANGVKNGSRPGIDLSLSGNTVTLTLKEQFLQGIDTDDSDAIFRKEGAGRDYVWVMMTFEAQYNKDYYDLAKVKDNKQNGDSWLENSDDKSGGAALTYVQNNAEVRQNSNNNNYIIKLGDNYYKSSNAKTWEDVTGDASYYVPRWDGNGNPKFNKLEGSAILDVTGIAIPEEAGITANGFVKDATEEHSGTKNQAEYKLTRGNNPASEYKTNIVTVDAPMTKFEAEKKWKNADGSDATWPEGVDSIEVDVIEINKVTQAEKTVDTIVLREGEAKKQSKELPKLNNATYRLEEVTVDGYTTASEDMAAADLTEGSESGKVFTNTKDVEEKPEIEKFVNEAVHKDITFDEEFTYDIVAYVTKDAEEVTITDTLNDVLEFVTTEDQVAVYDLGTNNNHKVTNDVQAKKVNNDATVAGGTAYEGATSHIEEQTLTVTIADATDLQGHWIKVRFTAKIKEGLTIDDLQAEGVYKEVKGDVVNDFDADRATPNKGNAPVKAGAGHTGVPNDASYVINVNNEAKYNDRSNTVTVKPETTKVEVSKVWVLDGEDLAAEDWPEGATVEVKLQSKKGDEAAQDVLDSEGTAVTTTLSADQQSYTFENLPVLTDVTYSVAEGTVENAGIYEIGEVEEVSDGVFKITNNGTTPEEEQPEIEKYVNKKSDEGTDKDGGVHTDLEAFDEVYTYDIQAYIAKDATVAEVTDELQSVLEFVGEASSVKVVVKEGEADGKAPKLSKAGKAPEDTYTVDPTEWAKGKLVLTLGDAEGTEILKSAGMWIQITFDAKIKDDYRSIEALKDAGANVWETIKENDPIDDATVDGDNHSGATIDSHEGIVNDSSYKMKKFGVDVGNTWTYEDASNTVTVQPKTTEVTVSKEWVVDGAEAEWPEGAEVEVKVIGKDGEEVATDKLTAEKQSITFSDLPCLEDVTYTVEEGEVTDPEGTATGFAFGKAEEVEEGVFKITNTKGEKPEIEKYVNKKSDEGTAKDGGVHTDLAAFDEVYTYDIQAYITSDAKYVEVTDQLKEVLEFVGSAPTAVAIKAGEGEDGMTAPKLSKSGEALAAGDYKVDETAWAAGKLVLTMGSTDATEVVKGAGMWLQITFDAKIKDDYRSVEAIKGVSGVWTTIKANDPIDDATVDALATSVEADKSKVKNHAGIVNDASYTINVGVENAHQYKDSSNKVTVKPSVTKLTVSKEWVVGTEVQTWPNGAEVEVKVIGKDGDVVATDTLKADKQSVTFTDLPCLEGVTYEVEEGEVKNAGIYEIGAVEKVKEGEFKITNKGEKEEPEIEKYVNKKSDEGTAKDGGVHTDLEAFDEVYTYDIQAYIAKDATVAEVTDELQSVLEFVGNGPTAVVVKEGEADGKAPKLSKEGTAPEDAYAIDEDAWKNGKLILTLGDAEGTEILKSAGMWLQITFDAKIKDEYRSIEDLKKAGANVWTEIVNNDPIDDATVDESHSEATPEKHEGIANDSSYKMKKFGVDVGNNWSYKDDSNTVTVQPATEELTVSKEWVVGTEVQKWPNGAEVEVKVIGKDGEVVATDKLTAEKTSVTFSDIPCLEDVTYTVEEGEVTNEGDYTIGDVTKVSEGVFKITNTKASDEPIVETTEITVTKVWNDANNQDGIRPISITVYLRGNGGNTGMSAVLNAANNWTAKFENLPLKEGDEIISYNVIEIGINGYECTVEKTGDNEFVLTNTHTPEVTTISGSKTWDDNDNRDGKRPESITIRLMKGSAEVASKTVTEADGWAWTFTDLPKYENGTEITYTITEDAVTGYTSKVEGYNVTNSYTPGETSLKVTKVWDDEDDKDELRPESVVITLYADGVKTDKTVTLSKENNWQGTFEKLPEMKNGKKIVYTVDEEEVPEGYEKTVEGTTITNKHVPEEPAPETRDINVRKVWDDWNNFENKRPASVTVRLFADGKDAGVEPLVLSAANDWKGTFKDLPKTVDGKEITYTVVEDHVDYYIVQTITTADGFVLSNISRPWIPQIPMTPGHYGNVTVTKTVSGGAETGKEFGFIAKITWASGMVTEQQFTLKANESYTLEYIPEDAEVEIIETNSDGYKVSYTVNGIAGSKFKVQGGATTQVVVNNSKPTPQTGDENNMMLWIVIAAATALLAVGAITLRKKN